MDVASVIPCVLQGEAVHRRHGIFYGRCVLQDPVCVHHGVPRSGQG